MLLGIVAVYLVQGLAAFTTLAIGYLLKDEMRLEPTVSQVLTTTMATPWAVKPLFGMLSDSRPLFGYHRRSYLVCCAAASAVAFIWLSIRVVSHSIVIVTLLLLVTNLSAAFNDVIIDARMVEVARLDPANGASDLQSLSRIALSAGGILGSLLAGPATHRLGPRGVFFAAAVGPCVIIAVALAMTEERRDASTAGACWPTATKQARLLWGAVRHPVIWRSVLWIFLATAISPGYPQVSFYFATDILLFNPEFLGICGAVAWAVLLLGTAVYNSWLTAVPFRRILFWAQIGVAVASLLNLLLVTRANLTVGISDKVFVLGDEVLEDIVGRLKSMPVLVLCAKLCPKGVEGTMFALFMSIMNLASAAATYWGAAVCAAMGIGRGRYGNLWAAILLRGVLKFLPVFFLFLIPEGDPEGEVAALTATLPSKCGSGDDAARTPRSPVGPDHSVVAEAEEETTPDPLDDHNSNASFSDKAPLVP